MNRCNRSRLVVTCSNCALHEEIETPNEGVAFYRRHRSLTGHDLEWERADIGLHPVPSGDLHSAIGELERRLDGAVPLGVVTVAMGERGATIGETLEGVRELRLEGKLYEPRDDHLRVT